MSRPAPLGGIVLAALLTASAAGGIAYAGGVLAMLLSRIGVIAVVLALAATTAAIAGVALLVDRRLVRRPHDRIRAVVIAVLALVAGFAVFAAEPRGPWWSAVGIGAFPIAAAVAALATVLALSGRAVPAVVGAVGMVAVTTGLAIGHVQGAETAALQHALAGNGLPERPWVADIPRHVPIAITGDGPTTAIYYEAPEDDDGDDVVLAVRRAVPPTDPVCRDPWWGFEPSTAPFLETLGCRAEGSRFVRWTADLHAVARFADDVVVIAAAPTDVPIELLHDAVATARPMTDDEFRAWIERLPLSGRRR